MKRKVLLLLLTVFTLSACGVSDSPIVTDSSSSVEIEIPVAPESTEASPEASSEEIPPESTEVSDPVPEASPAPVAIASGTVRNNGTLFVKSNGLVYFRIPSRDSMNMTSISTDFLTYIPGSTLASYDPETAEVKELLSDNSYGNLFFTDNILMISNSMDDETRTYTLLEGLDLKTDSVMEYNGTSYLGIDPTNTYVVVNNYDYYRNNSCFDIYQSGKYYASISPDGLFDYVGFCDNTVVYIVDNGDESSSLWSYDLASGEEIMLGNLPTIEYASYAGTPEQVITQGSTLYVSLADYEGTGHFYSGAVLVSADVHTEMSLEELYLPDSGEEFPNHAPRFTVTRGNVNSAAGTPNTADVNHDTGYIGYYDENGDWNPVAAEYGSVYSNDYENVTMVETAELIDDKIYFVQNDLIHVPEDDIGWRTAYRRTATRIGVIDINTKELISLAVIDNPQQ